jgi:hypothetical protein
MLALALDLPATASIKAPAIPAQVENNTVSTGSPTKSPLIADCIETAIVPSPLAPRPTLRRATFAAKPSLHHRHHARPHKKHHARPHKKSKPRAHRAASARHGKATHVRHTAAHRHGPRHVHRRTHRPAAHRPAPARPVLHRVTYASPLCAERSTVLNDMLGLPDYLVTQLPVAADSTQEADLLPIFIDLPPVIGGPVGPGPIAPWPPVVPIFPVGPGPIVILPPGPPPITPPVTPPISPAPEPSSWAMMLVGMLLVGGSLRRRSLRKPG